MGTETPLTENHENPIPAKEFKHQATRALHELLLIARDTPAPMLSTPETQQFLDVQRSGVREASHD